MPAQRAQPAQPTIDPKLIDTIVTLRTVLTQVLDPATVVTPDQLHDVMEMFLSLMFMQKVTPDFWVDHASMCTRGIALANQIGQEFTTMKCEGLSEKAVETIKAAAQLSTKEIRELRVKLLAAVELMKKCPLPGTKIH